MNDRSPLRLVASRSEDPSDEAPRRILAPGAPPSPGALPNDLAVHLRHGEALVWWGIKDHTQLGPVWMVLGAVVAILGFATLFAPEFWAQPWRDLAKPIAALVSPAAFVLVRERINQRAVLVTDAGILDVDPDGTSHRLSWGSPLSIHRDLLRGGLTLRGRGGQVRIPPTLVDDARQAVRAGTVGHVRGATDIDDRVGWLS